MADCADLIARHELDIAATRQAVEAMLDEQRLPLRGNARPESTEPRTVQGNGPIVA